MNTRDALRVELEWEEVLAADLAEERAAHSRRAVELPIARLEVEQAVHTQAAPQRQRGGEPPLEARRGPADVDDRGVGARHRAALPVVAHDVDRLSGGRVELGADYFLRKPGADGIADPVLQVG